MPPFEGVGRGFNPDITKKEIPPPPDRLQNWFDQHTDEPQESAPRKTGLKETGTPLPSRERIASLGEQMRATQAIEDAAESSATANETALKNESIANDNDAAIESQKQKIADWFAKKEVTERTEPSKQETDAQEMLKRFEQTLTTLADLWEKKYLVAFEAAPRSIARQWIDGAQEASRRIGELMQQNGSPGELAKAFGQLEEYSRWVNEDVAFLLAEQEFERFKRPTATDGPNVFDAYARYLDLKSASTATNESREIEKTFTQRHPQLIKALARYKRVNTFPNDPTQKTFISPNRDDQKVFR